VRAKNERGARVLVCFGRHMRLNRCCGHCAPARGPVRARTCQAARAMASQAARAMASLRALPASHALVVQLPATRGALTYPSHIACAPCRTALRCPRAAQEYVNPAKKVPAWAAPDALQAALQRQLTGACATTFACGAARVRCARASLPPPPPIHGLGCTRITPSRSRAFSAWRTHAAQQPTQTTSSPMSRRATSSTFLRRPASPRKNATTGAARQATGRRTSSRGARCTSITRRWATTRESTARSGLERSIFGAARP